MSTISKIMKTITGIFVLLLTANTSSAGVELSVTPENGVITVPQGGTINYIATVTADADPLDFPLPQDEVFSIDEIDKQPGWDYLFDPGTVRLENPGESKSTKLTINIASDAEKKTRFIGISADDKTDVLQFTDNFKAG